MEAPAATGPTTVGAPVATGAMEVCVVTVTATPSTALAAATPTLLATSVDTTMGAATPAKPSRRTTR